MKSIISRYGELKVSPTTLIDAEGEELSFNKVDAALQSVGVSMHDANGQFRAFDEVIMDLSKTWQTLDRNTQRYIATVMAGNRQQSRFLALVSDYERLSELTEEAANAQDAGTLQYLKTLDSIETKLNQLKVAFQEFYTSMGLEDLFKGALDTLTGFIEKLNSLPKIAGKFPAVAIGLIWNLISSVKNAITSIVPTAYSALTSIKNEIQKLTGQNWKLILKLSTDKNPKSYGKEVADAAQKGADQKPIQVKTENGKIRSLVNSGREWSANHPLATKIMGITGAAISSLGSILSTVLLATTKDKSTDEYEKSKVFSGWTGLGANVIGSTFTGAATGGWVGAILGALSGLVASITNLITLFDGYNKTISETLELYDKEIEAAKNLSIQNKANAKTALTEAQKLETLKDARYSSNEAMQEYLDYCNELADLHPELISGYDGEHNAIISIGDAYAYAAEKAQEAAKAESEYQEKNNARSRYIVNDLTDFLGSNTFFQAQNTFSQFFERLWKDMFTDDTFLAIKDIKDVNPEDVKNLLSRDQLSSWGYGELNTGAPILLTYTGNTESAIQDLINYEAQSNEEAKAQTAILANVIGEARWSADYWKGTKLENVIPEMFKLVEDYQENEQYQQAAIQMREAVQQILTYGTEELNTIADYTSKDLQKSYTYQGVSNLIATTDKYTSSNLTRFQTNNTLQGLYEVLIDYYLNNTDELIDFFDKKGNLKITSKDEYVNVLQSRGQEYADLIIQSTLDMTDKQLDELSKVLQNVNKYSSAESYKQALQSAGLLNEELLNSELELYNSNREKIIEQISYDKLIERSGDKVTDNSKKYLNQLINIRKDSIGAQYLESIQEDYMRAVVENTLRAKDQADAALKTWYFIAMSDLDEQNKQILLDKYQALDKYDSESIKNFIDDLESDSDYEELLNTKSGKEIIDGLTTLQLVASKNFNTIVNNYAEKAKTTANAISKQVKSGLEGMNYSEAIDLINELSAGQDFDNNFKASLIEWDNNLQQFVLSISGLSVARQKIIDDFNKSFSNEIDDLNQSIATLTDFTEEDITTEYTAGSIKASLIYSYQESGLEFELWKEQTLKQYEQAIAEYNALNEWFETFLNSQWAQTAWKQLDWEKIKVNADSEDNFNKIEQYLTAINRTDLVDDILTLWIAGNIEEVYNKLREAGNIQFNYDEAATIINNKFADTASKISDIFNTTFGTTLSQEINDFAVSIGAEGFELETHKVINSFDDAVKSARAIYNAMEASNAEIADQNYAYAALLEGLQLERDSAKGIIESSADLSYDNLADYANLLGMSLKDIINDTGYIILDNFGKYRISDEGIAQLTEKVNVSEWELAEAIKSRNEALIEADKKITGGIVDEINALMAAKPGDKVDLTYLSTKFKDIIQDLGLNIENGLATITENTNIFDIVNKIQAAIIEDGSFLQSDIDALGDALDQLLKTYTSLIGNGISGTLSRSDATQLQNFATANLGGLKLDFNKTANGLKLSRNSALQLYAALKNIDSLAASITLENFVEELEKTDTQFNNISATMSHIHDLQTQIENGEYKNLDTIKAELVTYQDLLQVQRARADSYSFMDNKLPEGMQAPENYWNAVGTAYKAMNESAKSGYMEIQDFYNIVNEMNNLANITGNTLEFMGRNLSGKAEDAANLITWAMDALSNVDGEGVKLDLSKLGVDLSAGADSMSSGFDKAINQMAESQIKMLDAEIALLEAIVAMEEIGKVDVEGNGLDLKEIFQYETTEEGLEEIVGFTDNWVKALETIQTAMEESPDLTKALESVTIQGHTLAEIISTPYEELSNLGVDPEQYKILMNSILQMAKSGDYSLENVAKSVAEIAAANGVTTEIQLDSGTIAVGYGYSLIKDDKKDAYIVDGKEYPNADQALQAMALQNQKDLQNIHTNEITGNLEAEWRVADYSFAVVFEDNQLKYKCGNNTFNSQQDAINWLWNNSAEKKAGGTKQKWAEAHHISMEFVPDFEVDQTKMQSASADAKQTLAQELASGQVTEGTLVSVGITYNKDLNNLSDADLQQIADLAGIDRKTVSLNLAADITGDEGGKIEEMILKGQITVTMNLEPNTSSIDLTNLTATGTGTLKLSDCTFTLDDSGNVVVQDADGNTVDKIPVPALSGEGDGDISKYTLRLNQTNGSIEVVDTTTGETVDSVKVPDLGVNNNSTNVGEYKLVFDQGQVKLVDAENQAVSSITFPATNVDPDSATGTVPEYRLTLENGHIKLYQGEQELGSIPVPDKPVNDGSGTVEHYNLKLANGAIVLLDSNNQVMNYIPVPGLKGDGSGYITTATFKFDPYSGMVSVVDSKNSDIRTQFPILDLAGIGTGTLAAGDCTFTYDGNDVNVQTKDAKGNDVIITVPLSDGKGTGSLPASNCTYTYEPNTGEITVEGLDSEGAQASFTFNLADYGVQVAGTSSFNENQLTYTYQPVNGGLLVNVKGLDGQQFAFKIPSGVPITGTGVFYQDNVELLYIRNPNGSVSVSNGTMTVDLPSDIATKAYGEFTQDNLHYTYKKQENGTVHVEGFEGENKVIEFDVPEDVTTEANILSAILKWAGGGGWDYDELLDDDKKVVVEGLSVLGYVDNITLKKRGAALGTEIAALYNNANFGLADFSNSDSETYQENYNKAKEYVQLMEQLQTTENALLTGQDRTILTALSNLNINNDAPDYVANLAEQANQLLEMDDANLQQMVTIIEALSQALGGLSPEQFISLATALLDMATSSKDIFANDWDGLVNNLTSISSQNFSNFQTWSSKLSTILTQVLGIWSYIRNFANQTFTVDLKETKTVTVNHGSTTLTSDAKGNVALAAGRTLMGELGPELWVSNGHYYVAGQNGAEFVNLPKDAIVFNHLQTKKLLSSGKAGRGIAVTSDAAAVANAAGTTGPAMASAKEALAQLKQIRAMWKAMMDASAKDLGAMAGRGGSGGGGGGNDEKFNAQIGDFERWYNLLRKIENEEQKINQLEAERQNMRNGRNYMRSVEAEMESLHKEVEYSRQLADLQKDYYNRRRKDEEDSAFGKTIFTYTEEGLMQYLDGPGKGLDILAHLNETDENGKYINAAESAVKQLQYLASVGFDYSKLAYDNETGKTLSATNEEEAAQIMEHFWDEFDGWIDELDGLRDSYNDKLKEIQDLLKKEADLRKDMIDDQIDLEKRVLDAIIKEQELIIEAMTKEKDALVEASNQYIEGLNKALQKERDLYNQNQDVQDRQRLQRQIDILKRSGGSASEIKTLSDQLTDKLQESYFDAQQKQIDAVKEASDLEIERLERQIELAQETLDYWRDNNLFNPKVQEILAQPAQSIIAFLTSGAGGSDTFKGLSQVAQQQELAEITTLVQKWDEDRGKQADIDDILTRAQQEHEELTPEDMLDIHKAYETEYSATMAKLKDNEDLTEAEKKSQARAAGRAAAQEAIKTKTTKATTTETTPESVPETTTTEPEQPQFKSFTGSFDKSGSLALYKERGDKQAMGYFGPSVGTGRTFTVLDYDPSTPDWAYVETSLMGKKGKFKGWAKIGASSSILKSTKDQLRGGGGGSATPTTTPVGGGVVRQPTPTPSTPAPETKKGTFFGQIAEMVETKKTGVTGMFKDLVTPIYDTKNLKGTLAPNTLDNSVTTDNSVNIENLNVEIKELVKDAMVEEAVAAAKGLVSAKKRHDSNNIRSLRS